MFVLSVFIRGQLLSSGLLLISRRHYCHYNKAAAFVCFEAVKDHRIAEDSGLFVRLDLLFADGESAFPLDTVH